VLALGAQKRNVNFRETGFIGQPNFTVDRYSGTSYGLLRNNRVRFQDNVVEINWIWEGRCNTIAPIFGFSKAIFFAFKLSASNPDLKLVRCNDSHMNIE
jgi:hypothetical protein